MDILSCTSDGAMVMPMRITAQAKAAVEEAQKPESEGGSVVTATEQSRVEKSTADRLRALYDETLELKPPRVCGVALRGLRNRADSDAKEIVKDLLPKHDAV